MNARRNGSQRTGRRNRRVVLLLPLLAVMAVLAGLVTALTPAQSANALACLTAPPGIEAWWPGNDTGTDVVHGRDATLANGAAYAAGTVGRAFSFDGVDDVASVPDSPVWPRGTASFTQAMWVNLDTTARAVFATQDEGAGPAHPKWMFYEDSDVLQFWINDMSWFPTVTATWAPTAGTWYHVAVTRSGDQWTLYVNGAVVGSATNAAAIPDVAAPFRLGYAETNENGVFSLDGAVDEAMVFHRALSTAEVKAIHDAGSAGVCPPVGSSITFTPSAARVWPQTSVTLTGRLSLLGGLSAANRTVAIDKTVGTGAPTTLATVTTGTSGAFSYTTRVGDRTTRYTARFEGADNAVPATRTTTVTVRPLLASRLTLTTSRQRLQAGSTAVVTARLADWFNSRAVTIKARRVEGTTVTVRTGQVSKRGTLSVRVRPRANTDYWATYAGDRHHQPVTSAKARVVVSPVWQGRAINGYATRNGYRLYHWSRACDGPDWNQACPTVVFQLSPWHPDWPVAFTYQRKVNGVWRGSVYHWRLFEHSDMRVFTTYRDRDIVGVQYRCRIRFAGDATHGAATSRWVYWMVTG